MTAVKERRSQQYRMRQVASPIRASAWQAQAACLDTPDVDVFFDDEEAAVQVCEPCQVKDECLLEALAARVFDGVRGGLTAEERARLRAGAR